MVELFQQEEEVISDFLRSLGPWTNHVVIGGGYALIIYNLYMSNQNSENLPPTTKDIDSIVPRKVPKTSHLSILDHLDKAGFEAKQRSIDAIPTLYYVKEVLGNEVEVEFLTDHDVRNSSASFFSTKYDNCHVSGITAQPLKYIKQSFENSIPFTTRSGASGKVVSPEAWIFHKGLTFPLRKEASKVCKDLYGIWYAASQLGEFSSNSLLRLELLFRKYPKRF